MSYTCRSQCQIQKKIAAAFVKRFTLTDPEISILTNLATSSDQTGGIKQEFFDTLDHLQKIHKDCSVLLAIEGHQNAGLEILNKMNEYQVYPPL